LLVGQNHALLGEQLKRAEAYMDKSRQQRLRTLSTSGVEGPVKL
jgi:hypothetical protein